MDQSAPGPRRSRVPASRWRIDERTRVKITAVLAAGAILGVGGTHTLAYWTHQSHASATITTADFPAP
ncbi:SipW-dependent-type signal peptide-containing protein [Sediminivirga luteola]|nr:SipW-dependent-type signal peptide-containing protein [Sediminivirga luteola]